RPRAPVLDELSMPIHRWNTVSRDELEDPSPTNEGQRVRQHDECVGPWACRRREQSVEVARAVDLKGYRPHFECSRCEALYSATQSPCPDRRHSTRLQGSIRSDSPLG